MVVVHETPLQSVWSRFSPQLQDALYGAYSKHGVISTRKAFAALQGIDDRVASTFGKMTRTTIPLEGQSSEPNNNWREGILFENISCSPCVDNACRRLAHETESTITADLFFEFLVTTSCGPTIQQWRADGYSPESIVGIYREDRYRE